MRERRREGANTEESPQWKSLRVLEVDVQFGVERILQFTVSSADEGLGLFVLSRDCGSTIDPSSLENVEIIAGQQAKTMHLKFNKFGRMTISKNSQPAIGDGKWFVHILMDRSLRSPKDVTFTLESRYNYPSGQVWFAGVVAFIIGVGVVFLYYALVSDLPPLKEIFVDLRFKSFYMTISNWFKRGNKGYSYITGIFAITFAVGGYQVGSSSFFLCLSTFIHACCITSHMLYNLSWHLRESIDRHVCLPAFL